MARRPALFVLAAAACVWLFSSSVSSPEQEVSVVQTSSWMARVPSLATLWRSLQLIPLWQLSDFVQPGHSSRSSCSSDGDLAKSRRWVAFDPCLKPNDKTDACLQCSGRTV
eukprot:s2839_g13.t1